MQIGLLAKGPLSICVDAEIWQLYVGGVISAGGRSLYETSSKEVLKGAKPTEETSGTETSANKGSPERCEIGEQEDATDESCQSDT